MSDMDHNDEFDKAFQEALQVEEPSTPPAEPPKEDNQDPTPEPKKSEEEPKKDEQPPAEPPKKEGEEDAPTTTDAPKTEEEGKKPKAPEAPPAQEEPKPLTRDDVASIINNIRIDERTSAKELETTTNDVLEAYYPDGLSNTLVDQTTGKELKTPQDVAEITGWDMEKSAQWLMNEQFKLDQEIASIKESAQKVAETTINFKRDSIAALQKYEPLFKWQPHLQQKAFKLLMGQVKADEQKGVILSAPDVMDLYDTYLEPYQQAYEFSKGQPATNPNPPAPEPPKPGAEDRLDDDGDGGATTDVDDPNDFAQQVKKELAKGL